MKKMYLAIFLIILVVFVFAGCLSFSGSLSTMTTEEEEKTFYQPPADLPDVTNTYPEETSVPVQSGEQPSVQETTQAPSENNTETTTQSSGSQQITVPAANDFDVVASGNFYMTGTMIDSTGLEAPLEIAITSKSVYMKSALDGIEIGLLLENGKNMYMLYPKKKAYLEMTDTVMEMTGMSIDDFSANADFDFSGMGSLAQADSVIEEVYNGRKCQVYIVNNGGETKKVYMDGSRLVRMATYTSSGKLLSASNITSVTANVPADKSAPPSDYKAYKGAVGLGLFMAMLMGEMEI